MNQRSSFLRQQLSLLAERYETLTPDSVDDLLLLYAADASFKDPFNDVQGVERIGQIFTHMFQQVDRPAFRVDESLLDGEQAMLLWRFGFITSGRAIEVRGSSYLRFDADGHICVHRDYWDPAGELYSRLPVLGVLMRWLSRRLSAVNTTN